jgi:hypothetical protein
MFVSRFPSLWQILWSHALEQFIGSPASSWMKPLGGSQVLFSTFPIVHLSHLFSVFLFCKNIAKFL